MVLVISCKAELRAWTLSDDEASRRLRLSVDVAGNVGTRADKEPIPLTPTKAARALSGPTTSLKSRSTTKAFNSLSWRGVAVLTREVI